MRGERRGKKEEGRGEAMAEIRVHAKKEECSPLSLVAHIPFEALVVFN